MMVDDAKGGSLYAHLKGYGFLATRQCGICGRGFPAWGAEITVTTPKPENWTLDVGGYCRTCRAYRCPDHARLTRTAADGQPAGGRTPGLVKLVAACGKCGAALG